MPDPPPEDDPPPVPPVRPSLDDCCGQGCDPCVFDVYDDALQRYRAAVKAWRKRNPGRTISDE
ncbi:MAG TPA: oxidoreductase-like domain-containing protein [Casimicrobiaceae bacterium]|nr:oxidoreductase-like domain-containing protein [Casimicrobiaceae bacterium]